MNFSAVIDNSALIEFLAGSSPDRDLVRRMLTANAAAPQLIDAELLAALRRLVHKGALTEDQAYTTLQHGKATPITRIDHEPLLDRAWEMRDAITAYDALYVTLAERLDVPLITCDARLGGSNGHRAKIEVYPVS